ncbi:sterol desaturase family protein [Robiginitalea sp. M366]|uniref:sterol desaturase family protein n=1 Tax=Robiginitalea aestuariiviva TaxID=3036903 RepID=UPI00240D83CA|nr:sterol desaturase family protein [Robiginitalea aestuariiviva]MDG1572995.1 sterol desaturase family protein [Robiginitalea aestuariiviva]
MNFADPLVYGVPCFIAFIILELAYSKTKGDHHIYHWKDLFASGFMGVGSAIIGASLKILVSLALFEGVFEFFNPLDPQSGVRTNVLGYEAFGYAWYIWPLCMLADDFTYYWFHRANHEIRILWAAHIVHHSSENFNLGTAVRNGWFTLLYKPLFYAWMPAVGFPPEMVLVCLGIEALWQFQLHTVYAGKLGIFEKWINTHTMHQVHHAQNLEYMDKNHGGILNIFDRVFGTWQPLDESIDIRYGVVHAPNSYNPLVILTHEFKDIWADVRTAKTMREAFMYVFGPPGWSPDRSTLTVRQQQALLKESAKA